MSTLRHASLALLLAASAAALHAAPATYHYDGDTAPSSGTYGQWFTTVGPGHPTGGYFLGTTWASNGGVLTMNNVSEGLGIWFGIGHNYNDAPGIALANTASGNWARARLAIDLASGQSDTSWAMYWYDSSGYGSAFIFYSDRFSYHFKNGLGADQSVTVHADMTQYHTFTSYVLAGQVSYFYDNTYLGGGGGITGANNFFLIGDGSASTPSGVGSMRLDYLTIITAVGDTPPSSIPEPSAFAALAGLSALSLGALRRRPSRATLAA